MTEVESPCWILYAISQGVPLAPVYWYLSGCQILAMTEEDCTLVITKLEDMRSLTLEADKKQSRAKLLCGTSHWNWPLEPAWLADLMAVLHNKNACITRRMQLTRYIAVSSSSNSD